MPSLQDIESMMVGIDDMEEFKRVFLIFACATLLAPTSRLEGSHSLWRKESVWIKGCLMFLQIFYFSISTFPTMYVELTTPRIAAWNDFLVKQRIKLELEMLRGFGKLVNTSRSKMKQKKNKAPVVDDPVDPDENEDFDVICARMETTQRQITDAQSHLNSLIASYNRDVKGARKTQRRRCVFFSNEDLLHPGPHNMLVLVQSCMNTDYVFDESKDPSEMLCAYGGYGVTQEQLQCLVGESFIDIPVRCHTGMYVILYMQHWDGSGLNRTINSERMSLERLKFATHMFLIPKTKLVKWLQLIFGQPTMQNSIGVTDKLIEEDEFDADQKNAFKTMSERQKKANRQAREARKKALQKWVSRLK
ncbi:hypothetical protein CK203_068969 [Vitis vinifera]|uniref:Uncharacterized protein n=1 Tax=Vitis vinifera TaxID=29760 RepID=A0A438F123_VITVI|nr:hypothetical protein CK203_068969 [Vitis vinifera]